MVTTQARRRQLLFDGKGTLAAFVSSISDIDDLIPSLTAFQIEWNKMHACLSESSLADERQVLQWQAFRLVGVGPVGHGTPAAGPAFGLDEVDSESLTHRPGGAVVFLGGGAQRTPRVVGHSPGGLLQRYDFAAASGAVGK